MRGNWTVYEWGVDVMLMEERGTMVWSARRRSLDKRRKMRAYMDGKKVGEQIYG